MVYLMILSLIIQHYAATLDPSTDPTTPPSIYPTANPTSNPTDNPTATPSKRPTLSPTKDPTTSPTEPTMKPTKNPTTDPTNEPTFYPTKPTMDPTTDPTFEPTQPTIDPTIDPTMEPIEPTLEPFTFCVIQSRMNYDRWTICGITMAAALFTMFIILKFAVKIKMKQFCSIFTLISLCISISLAISSVAYGIITSDSLPSCGYQRQEVYPIPIATDMSVYALYTASMIVAWIIFVIVLVAKIYLLRIGQEFEEEFKEKWHERNDAKKSKRTIVHSASTIEVTNIKGTAYTSGDFERDEDIEVVENKMEYDTNDDKCYSCLVEKMQYQIDKFMEKESLLRLLGKFILFVLSFSLCATLTSLYQVGTSYNEYGDIIYYQCGCIDSNIGQIAEIYGQGIVACLVGPLMVCTGYCIYKIELCDDGDSGCETVLIVLLKGIIYIYALFCALYGICIILFAIISPFLLIAYRSIAIFEMMQTFGSQIDFDVDFNVVMYFVFLLDAIIVFVL